MLEIAALWKSQNQAGETMLSGKLGNSRILILPNKYKSKENQPDYRLFVVADNNKKQDQQQAEHGSASAQEQEPSFNETDEIPF